MNFISAFIQHCCGKEETTSHSGSAENRPIRREASTGQAKMNFASDNVGAKITDHYKMDKKALGEGSYGTVSVGDHKATGNKRAIKKISKASSLKSKQQTARLKVEIDIMKCLDHPGIVKLHETFEDKGSVYLVMDLSQGGELFDKIVSVGHFGEKDAAIVVQQMIGGIFYLHRNLVCHRDLKPENFLFQFAQKPIEQNVLKLIDFGLSCTFKPGQRFKTKAGTPYYVAPQVLQGNYDEASDLWSVGVIMYVLLCGYPPFYAESDAEVLQAVKAGKFDFTPADWNFVSSDAKELIKGLLRMDEKTRLNAESAYKHKWIKEQAPAAKSVNLKQGYVDNLRNFCGQNKLKKAALHVIAGQLGEMQVKNLRELFISLDADGDGMLTPKELEGGVTKAGIKMGTDLQALIRDMDADSSGAIDYTEFIASAIDMKTATQEDNCWAAFCVFDKDGNGKISMTELRSLLQAEGVAEAMGQQEAGAVMREVDKNGDGEIDFKEFMAMMKANK